MVLTSVRPVADRLDAAERLADSRTYPVVLATTSACAPPCSEPSFGFAPATASLLVRVGARARVRIGQDLSVDPVRPHLQAEHGLDVLASLGHALPGVLLQPHRIPVPLSDLLLHDPAEDVAEGLR